jgi:hypothetical protein
MGHSIHKVVNKSKLLLQQLASHSRCSSLCAERARDERFCPVFESVADGRASQYTQLEVERRASSETDVQESTSRQETGLGLTSKASPVRTSRGSDYRQKVRMLTMVAVPVKGLDDKKIVQIACGQQHSIALDEDGYAHRSNLRRSADRFPDAGSYMSGAIMAIAVWALGIRKTF